MASGEPDDMRPDERQARSPADYDAPDFLTVVYQRVFQLLDWRWPSEKGSDPEVSHLDAATRKAVAAGATLEGEISSFAWGRQATLSDPFGHGFCLLQWRGGGYDEVA